jgi:hypothetical protein
MKTPAFFSLLFVTAFACSSGPTLRAQDEPPPPPEQVGQQAPPDQGAPPPDQMGDQGAPPSDQGAPPPDQGAPDDQNGSDVSFQTFYDQLSSQGTWVQTDNYGYVWQPNVQDPDWRPYSDGHWVYTDEGWTWVADDSEPWGWATYHYGRWVNIDGEGWVWVPGYTWAPAWVSWRYGGGYCGWAPLPPETTVGIDFGGIGLGFHIGGDCDDAYDIGPGYYNFVPVGYIGARDYRPYYANRYNNYTIINNTRNVTNIVVAGNAGAGRFGRVTAGGPNFATLNAQSRTPIQRASLVRSNRVGNASLSGNRLAVFAPAIAPANGARPPRVGSTLSTVRVNRGTSIGQPLAVNSRVAPQGPSAQQVQAARTAEAKIPRTAKVATANTQPSRALTAPLTALPPHSDVRSAGATSAAVRPQTATVNTVSVPHTGSADRGDNAFTGGNAGEPTHHHDASSAGNGGPIHTSPSAQHETSFAPHTQGQSFTPHTEAPEAVHHESAPAIQHESAPVEHHQEQAQSFHPSAPAFHPSAPPAVHQASPLPAPHAAPPAQPQHSGGGGGGGGGGGKPGDDKGHH